MNIQLAKPTKGRLYDHISTPPALPICFDSSAVIPRCPAKGPLDFVAGVNAIAWGVSGEIYPHSQREEMLSEWNSVEHTVPAILSKWRNYGLFGTNIEGWFTLDPRDTDGMLRAIAMFGSVLWIGKTEYPYAGEARVLCGFHRSLGVNSLGVDQGIDFERFGALGTEAYVVIPTILIETDHPSTQYIHYNTLETK